MGGCRHDQSFEKVRREYKFAKLLNTKIIFFLETGKKFRKKNFPEKLKSIKTAIKKIKL